MSDFTISAWIGLGYAANRLRPHSQRQTMDVAKQHVMFFRHGQDSFVEFLALLFGCSSQPLDKVVDVLFQTGVLTTSHEVGLIWDRPVFHGLPGSPDRHRGPQERAE